MALIIIKKNMLEIDISPLVFHYVNHSRCQSEDHILSKRLKAIKVKLNDIKSRLPRRNTFFEQNYWEVLALHPLRFQSED